MGRNSSQIVGKDCQIYISGNPEYRKVYKGNNNDTIITKFKSLFKWYGFEYLGGFSNKKLFRKHNSETANEMIQDIDDMIHMFSIVAKKEIIARIQKFGANKTSGEDDFRV